MNRLSTYTALMLLLVLGLSAISATSRIAPITVKSSVDMRNGPGSYYKLLLRLKSGATAKKMDEEQQWLKIKASNKTGWIPRRSTYIEDTEKRTSPDQDQVKTSAEDAFDELADGETDSAGTPSASQAQVAAAVKGFAKDFTSQKTESKNTDLLQNFDGFVSPSAYKEFRNQRLQNWSWDKAQSRFELKANEAAGLDPLREQAGWGIANVIAQQGLVENEALQQYLTHITLVIAENSHRYETPVQVYILDSTSITGYASPNGSIFVSRGLLKLIKNEAEFAFFAAHELAHIVHNHGIKETEKRKPKIKAEQQFEELNQEIGERKEKYKKVEAELTKLANQMYEYTVKDRLDEYEYDADYWAVAYTYRAGYHPGRGLDLLKRINNQQQQLGGQIEKTKWKGASLQKRINKIENQLKDLQIPSSFGRSYEYIFQRKMQALSDN
ncbi:SH3 domain-containing protein [Fodinibius salinus]|uniref:SH3 domain-containing protein n=1 Tax=Fodinibius salinus TaxID=860790 RepID=A0A5D3YJN8_9BACT|nr:M48 family metalloprotease [Fodinibius salinus]TYP94054.1 SH3 domain-containing protein [Fodinibius salinus]